jgi:hypothetical protein
VGPVTETAACLGGPVTETTVGLAVNKDKMLEAYETGDKAPGQQQFMLQVPPGPLSSREHIVFYLIFILVLLGTKVRLFLVLNMLTSIQRLFITRIFSWLGWFFQRELLKERNLLKF